jgi:hypothetical protein
MPRLATVTAFVALISSTAVIAPAQSNTTHFNIAAGLTLPTGSFGDDNDAGYNLILGLGTRSRTSPLGFRAEGIFSEFDAHGSDQKSRAAGITGNLTYDLTSGTRTNVNSLYIIGGIGYYSTRQFRVSETNVGWNVGGGFQFPLSGFSAYVEARYHTVSNTDVRFVPISFGLIF